MQKSFDDFTRKSKKKDYYKKYYATHKRELNEYKKKWLKERPTEKYKKWRQEYIKNYQKTEKRKKYLKDYKKKYFKIYNKTEKRKKYLSEYYKNRYKSDDVFREKTNNRVNKWRKTEKGKINNRKQYSIYKRGKKWIELFPNIFPSEIPIDYHHIDGKLFVVPLPRKIHRKHQGSKPEHITENVEWVEFFYGINPEDLLREHIHG